MFGIVFHTYNKTRFNQHHTWDLRSKFEGSGHRMVVFDTVPVNSLGKQIEEEDKAE